MTSRERLEKCWAFETPDRVPFIPAVYEQKAFLIIGGNTTRLADAYARTGSGQILCDFPADWSTYKQLCTDQHLAVRRNISPGDIQNGTPEELAATARQYLADAGDIPGFILGTAVLPYGTPTPKVLAIHDAVRG